MHRNPIQSSFRFNPVRKVCYRKLSFMGFCDYRVGDDGSVWSKNGRWDKRGIWVRMKPVKGTRYYYVTLNGRQFAIYRLVLTAFVGSRPKGREARHFPDRDPANNRLENLRWDTHKNNIADKRTHGTWQEGENCGTSVSTARDVREMRRLWGIGVSVYRIAKMFGRSKKTVKQTVRREIWKSVD